MVLPGVKHSLLLNFIRGEGKEQSVVLVALYDVVVAMAVSRPMTGDQADSNVKAPIPWYKVPEAIRLQRKETKFAPDK